MLTVTLIAVGKLKERFWTEACAEYAKRLGAHCKLQSIEIDEARLAANPSPAEIQKCIETEGAAILAKLPARAHVVTLCVEGTGLTSEAWAAELAACAGQVSQLALIIGGSHGLSREVKARAARKLSISAMTFPHQLCRVLLLEQLYRGFSINSGSKYHK